MVSGGISGTGLLFYFMMEPKGREKKMPGIRGGEGFITLSSSQLLINSLFSPGKKKSVLVVLTLRRLLVKI